MQVNDVKKVGNFFLLNSALHKSVVALLLLCPHISKPLSSGGQDCIHRDINRYNDYFRFDMGVNNWMCCNVYARLCPRLALCLTVSRIIWPRFCPPATIYTVYYLYFCASLHWGNEQRRNIEIKVIHSRFLFVSSFVSISPALCLALCQHESY